MMFYKVLGVSALMTNIVYADIDTKQVVEGKQAKGVTVPFDNGELKDKWDFSYKVVLGDGSSIYEWVPKGEERDAWSKLIQIQFIPMDGEQIDATDFGNAFMKSLKEEAPDVTATMTPQSKNRVFIEWSIPKDTKDQKAQDELSEFISTPDGIYRIAYTEKGPTIDPEVKKAWIQRLSDAKVEETK